MPNDAHLLGRMTFDERGRRAREVANHIYFTDRGIIVEHGSPKTFFDEAKDPRTKEFLSQIL